MNCVEAKENIDGFIDGELYGPLRSSLEDHLRMCRPCIEVKDERVLLSTVLRTTTEIVRPSSSLDDRVLDAYRQHHRKKAPASWRNAIFGTLAIPKPVFAAFLVLAVAAPWIAFQIGKLDASPVLTPMPDVGSAQTAPNEESLAGEMKTVVVHVPVIKEKIVTRTIYLQGPSTKRKGDGERDAPSNVLPSYNSVAHRGYFTDLDLKGFQPPAEIGVRIIKEVKPDEK